MTQNNNIENNNRIVYIDPNDIRGQIKNTESDKERLVPLTPDYTDYSIWCNLIVERSSRLKNSMERENNEGTTMISFDMSSADNGTNYVSFMQGKDVEAYNFLTTDYTNIDFSEIKKRNIIEARNAAAGASDCGSGAGGSAYENGGLTTMDELLTLLEKDCRQTPQQLATMLGRSEQEITDEIARFEKEHIILGYPALVDWTKTDDEMVTALIEVRIAPQRGDGFDRIAARIYQYEEVESLYLMSGAYDLAVTITGKNLREVAEFVHARLAIIEGVTGTATHFILKKYKEKNHVFEKLPEQEERMLFV